ncbi:hypothetical protein GQ55_8G013900 [Panicum hallii var. hallii]|uniref:Uncharacterized protein n=2 Tax=Panicum hallii TaxID=206008 RepID=A0A2T7CJG2_9POAL|nr:hypothetical protein GQ55_8G013900 [Panicum hallii var. hallii]PVH33491.1 hypothetical protein PAHAL_8G012500 [Panicum hallii]PVH61325.1 hypothetical protein PAHAL_3G011600 [Panicum hallii]
MICLDDPTSVCRPQRSFADKITFRMTIIATDSS